MLQNFWKFNRYSKSIPFISFMYYLSILIRNTMHASILVDSLKRALKAKGITYADLAARIEMSEAGVKRMFSQKNFTLQKLEAILHATGLDLIEIAHISHDDSALI